MTHQVGALARFAAHAARDVTTRVQQSHHRVTRRAFALTGPVGLPARVVHDAVSAGVFGAVQLSLGLGGVAGGAGLGLVGDVAGWRPLSDTAAGGRLVALVNSVAGDRLRDGGSELALTMTIRHGGRDVDLTTAGLRRAFPGAGPDVVVFLHGLAETDRSWTYGGGHDEAAVSYGARLHADLGLTPVYLRYNTGLHISENGRHLDRLLDVLVTRWPVPVRSLHLVGHSMGGLVIRSACHLGAEADRPWVARLRHAVYLGTPHLGSAVARAGARLGQLLHRLPETRPFAPLTQPSAGIGDLRHGSIHDDDWRGRDLDHWMDDTCREVGLLPHCRHHAVSAGLTRHGDTILDKLVGDLLVQTTSATGRGHRHRRVDFVAEEGLSVGGSHHFSLLNHPVVYEQLKRWLTESEAHVEAEARAEALAELTGEGRVEVERVELRGSPVAGAERDGGAPAPVPS